MRIDKTISFFFFDIEKEMISLLKNKLIEIGENPEEYTSEFNFENGFKIVSFVATNGKLVKSKNQILATLIEDLDLSVRTYNRLKAFSGIKTLGNVLDIYTDSTTKSFGKKIHSEIEEMLRERKLTD